MAKLSIAYALCPLIDEHSLLGVTVDCSPGCVIATLGKNIVIRYKLENQRQVGSWSTKNKFTCPVIYDSSSSQYIAAFSNDQLRMWRTNDQLDSVTRYKFQCPMHCVIPEEEAPVILFRNGHAAPLSVAISSRKDEIKNPLLKPNDIIKDYCILSHSRNKYVSFISLNDKNEVYLNIVPVSKEEAPLRYPMSRKDSDASLVGHCIMTRDNSCLILTLWSDGSLFSFTFLPSSETSFPGIFLQKVSSVNTQTPVAMTPISGRSIALFGADPNEEGARLILLNLEFQVIEARLHFKLYTNPPKLWNVGNHLLVALGTNLIAVPYQLEKELLATLLGAHCSSVALAKESWFGNFWGKSKDLEEAAPLVLKDKVRSLRLQGKSQAAIVQSLLPLILEKKDRESLVWCLKNFSDIPEISLVQALKFSLLEPASVFYNSSKEQNGTSVLENGEDSDESPKSDFTALQPERRSNLVNMMLNVSFSSVSLLPHLRKMPLHLVMSLFSHLCYLMKHKSSVAPLRIIEWLCLLLDSHYQEYLLSNDENIRLILTKLRELVYSQVSSIQEFATLAPMLYRIRSGKVPATLPENTNKQYSIESLKL